MKSDSDFPVVRRRGGEELRKEDVCRVKEGRKTEQFKEI